MAAPPVAEKLLNSLWFTFPSGVALVIFRLRRSDRQAAERRGGSALGIDHLDHDLHWPPASATPVMLPPVEYARPGGNPETKNRYGGRPPAAVWLSE